MMLSSTRMSESAESDDPLTNPILFEMPRQDEQT